MIPSRSSFFLFGEWRNGLQIFHARIQLTTQQRLNAAATERSEGLINGREQGGSAEISVISAYRVSPRERASCIPTGRLSKNQPVCLILNCCVTLRVLQREGFSVTQIDRQQIEQQIEEATETSKLNVGPEHYWNCCAPELCVLAKRLRLAATGI